MEIKSSSRVARRVLLVLVVVFVLVAGFTLFLREISKVSAVPLSNGGDLDVQVTSVEVVGQANPTTADTQLCQGSREQPNFTAYFNAAKPPFVTVYGNDTQRTTLDFSFNLAWRDCNRMSDGYALFSGEYCPTSGYYGGPETAPGGYEVSDCVKYIENQHLNGSDNNTKLGCPYLGRSDKNPSQFCTTSIARGKGQFIAVDMAGRNNRAGPLSQTPASAGQTLTIDHQVQISRPSNGTRANGSDTYDGQICQYYWYANQSAAQSHNDVCRRLRINYSWTYLGPPRYELDATANEVDPSFSFYQAMPTPWWWGMTVRSAENMRPEGIGNHNMDLWRVVYPAAPSDGWAAGRMTNGDTGLCAALSGYSSCDRIAAYPCVNAAFGCGNTLNTATQGWQWQFGGEVGPYPVGTRVCYVSRVSMPAHYYTQNDWRGSAMRCSVSSKKPRVQFVGNDIRVAGDVRSSYFTVQGVNYGSWVEYGAFSSGVNSLLGSGNSLRNGSSAPASEWNKLTFANTPTYGSYGMVPTASSAHAWFSGLTGTTAPLNSADPASGVYSLGNEAQITDPSVDMNVANGRSVIIRVNGVANITRNINVPNTGVTSANGLSQVVIVANEIRIGEGVTNVDAWLVTPSTNGTIDTCYRGGNPALNSGICVQPLTVNGPVMTRNLKLRRTAGSNAPPIESLKDPAERFNLRPDAQLWSYVYANRADYAKTDYVQELPPRY